MFKKVLIAGSIIVGSLVGPTTFKVEAFTGNSYSSCADASVIRPVVVLDHTTGFGPVVCIIDPNGTTIGTAGVVDCAYHSSASWNSIEYRANSSTSQVADAFGVDHDITIFEYGSSCGTGNRQFSVNGNTGIWNQLVWVEAAGYNFAIAN